MKYGVIFSCLITISVHAADTVRECQREYVYCRAQAHDSCGKFYTKLKNCKKQYRACKQVVKGRSACTCHTYRWHNSFYFLG